MKAHFFSTMHTLVSFVKAHKKVSLFAGIILLLIAGWLFYPRPKVSPYETVAVQRTTVRNIVSVTGSVDPSQRLSLGFSLGGRLARLAVAENARVAQNDPLAFLDTTELSLQAQEAEARMRQEGALLEKIRSPLRPEEYAVQEASVKQAYEARDRADASANTALSHAYSLADSAVRKDADSLFTGSDGAGKRFGVSFTYGSTAYTLSADRETTSAIQNARSEAERALTRLRERTQTAPDKDLALTNTDTDLVLIERLLSLIASVVNDYVSKDTAAQTVYESYQTAISGARTAIASARTEVAVAHKELSATETALALAERSFVLAKAGASTEDVRVAEESYSASQNAYSLLVHKRDDATLRAPVAGVVGTIFRHEGEAVGAQEPILDLVSETATRIIAYIPEADVARVRPHSKALITFDAFDRTDIFEGEVLEVAFSETIREGVPTYKTIIAITNNPNNLLIRPGMTADIDIETDVREQVLAVPARSVVVHDDTSFVRVWNGTLEEREVKTGLRGSDGLLEIVSGVSEGEQIVSFIPEK